jgi:BirA family biotin operon repressor/biotin-[acetyl-CoA-carboxylase] ligase
MSSQLIIGNTLLKLNAVGSTNSYAHTLLKNQKIAEGLVIWAIEQTSGRGQMGTNWHSTPGDSLTFSVILTPRFLPLQRQFLLNKAVSCAVHAYAAEKNMTGVRIKWPNDVYIGEQKAGGILIENSIQGDTFQSSIVGIGLNLNQESFPGLPQATSFRQHAHQRFDAEQELPLLLSHLDRWYLRLRRNDEELINKTYQETLYGMDSWKLYRSGEDIFRAKVTGVNESGLLEIMTEDGSIRSYRFKEIEKLSETP